MPQRKGITLEVKKNIIQDVENGQSYDYILKKYSLKHKSNIVSILKSKERYLEALKSSNASLRKTTKKPKYETIDRGLNNFLMNSLARGESVNNATLLEKAAQIAQENGIVEFKKSHGFLDKFKKRNNMFFQATATESTGPTAAAVLLDENWITVKLHDLIQLVDPRNVYNLDELGLFWRLTPDKYADANPDPVCKLGEHANERFTVLIGANMDGSHKLPLAVVGNRENFRLRSVKYYPSATSWLSVDIFNKYLADLNEILYADGRNVLLFVDGCSPHSQSRFYSNITVHFLPSETISKLQPMDAGVKRVFKGAFRLKMVAKGMSISQQQAVEMALSSWSELDAQIIVHSFRVCGFYAAMYGVDLDQSDLDPIESALADQEREFQSLRHVGVDFDGYVNADEHLATCGSFEQEPQNLNLDDSEPNYEEELPRSRKSLSRNQINSYLEELKIYSATRHNNIELLTCLNTFERLVFEKDNSNTKKNSRLSTTS